MITWWRNFWDSFLNNEAYFVARVRAVVMAVAASGGLFAEETSQALGLPWVARVMKIAAVLAMGVAVLMRAGDKTPDGVKDMAADMGFTKPGDKP